MKRRATLLSYLAATSVALATIHGTLGAAEDQAPQGANHTPVAPRDPLVRPYTFNDAENALNMSVGLIASKPTYDVSGEQPDSPPDGAVTAHDAQVIAKYAAQDLRTRGREQPSAPAPTESPSRPATPPTESSTDSPSPAPPLASTDGNSRPTTTLADFTGMSRTDAQAVLTRSGIPSRYRVGPRKARSDAETDHVYNQWPPAGAAVSEGQTVELWGFRNPQPSQSPQEAQENDSVTVPNLSGLGKDEAEKAVRDLGLTAWVGTGKQAAPFDSAAGQVYRQSPPAGAKLPRGQTVTMVIYAPPQVAPPPRSDSNVVLVPNLVGRTEDDAAEVLVLAGFAPQIGRGKRNPTSADDVGRVYRQSPPAGASLAAGETVTLIIFPPAGGSVSEVSRVSPSNSREPIPYRPRTDSSDDMPFDPPTDPPDDLGAFEPPPDDPRDPSDNMPYDPSSDPIAEPRNDTAFAPSSNRSRDPSDEPTDDPGVDSSPGHAPRTREYVRQVFRATTDPNDENGYHRYDFRQTGDNTATVGFLLPQLATAEENQILRQMGVDPDFTFQARLQGDTWVVNDAKFHQFAGLLLGLVAAAGGADLTQDGRITPLHVEMRMTFAGRNLRVAFVKDQEVVSSEVATPE